MGRRGQEAGGRVSISRRHEGVGDISRPLGCGTLCKLTLPEDRDVTLTPLGIGSDFGVRYCTPDCGVPSMWTSSPSPSSLLSAVISVVQVADMKDMLSEVGETVGRIAPEPEEGKVP